MSELPSLTFEQAEDRAKQELGAILFTVTLIAPGNTEVSRVYSTHPDVYAVGGRKFLDPSGTSPIWYQQVLTDQQPFVGADHKAIEEFFADHETIAELGCGSIINTPVVLNGQTIGSVNFLGPEHTMTADKVETAMEITRQLTQELQAQRQQLWKDA